MLHVCGLIVKYLMILSAFTINYDIHILYDSFAHLLTMNILFNHMLYLNAIANIVCLLNC